MATALNLARTCGFTVFYWAHDVHLWDGTIPFSLYADSIAPAAPAANLALTGTLTASNTLSGFPASAANDANQNTYWQAADSTATLTLHLAQAAPVARIVLELPQNWGTRNQSVPGATIRAMPGDLERLPAAAAGPGAGPGPALLAPELLGQHMKASALACIAKVVPRPIWSSRAGRSRAAQHGPRLPPWRNPRAAPPIGRQRALPGQASSTRLRRLG